MTDVIRELSSIHVGSDLDRINRRLLFRVRIRGVSLRSLLHGLGCQNCDVSLGRTAFDRSDPDQ